MDEFCLLLILRDSMSIISFVEWTASSFTVLQIIINVTKKLRTHHVVQLTFDSISLSRREFASHEYFMNGIVFNFIFCITSFSDLINFCIGQCQEKLIELLAGLQCRSYWFYSLT